MQQNVDIDMMSFADSMAHSMSHEEILQFFRDIDIMVADWDFTKSCATYFNKEMENYGK